MIISTHELLHCLILYKKIWNWYFVIFSGQSPADAEFNFLEVAKNLDLYGVDLHFAKVRWFYMGCFNQEKVLAKLNFTPVDFCWVYVDMATEVYVAMATETLCYCLPLWFIAASRYLLSRMYVITMTVINDLKMDGIVKINGQFTWFSIAWGKVVTHLRYDIQFINCCSILKDVLRPTTSCLRYCRSWTCLDRNIPSFLMLMMLFSCQLLGIYTRNAARFLSKQGQLQPHFHLKTRQLST